MECPFKGRVLGDRGDGPLRLLLTCEHKHEPFSISYHFHQSVNLGGSMTVLEGLVFVQTPGCVLIWTVLLLLLLYFLFSRQGFHVHHKEPPGPRGLPLVGNLLQLDLNRPHNTLIEVCTVGVKQNKAAL